RSQIPPWTVGYHAANELRRQLAGLRDHPHTGLESFRPRDHAGDVLFAEIDTDTARLLSSNFGEGQRQEPGCHQSHQGNEFSQTHRTSTLAPLRGAIRTRLRRNISHSHRISDPRNAHTTNSLVIHSHVLRPNAKMQ